MSDTVNHPPHYGGGDNPYEVIKVIENWKLGFHLGNTVKYLARAGRKGDALEDLRKAKWYLDRTIEQLEKLRTERISPNVHASYCASQMNEPPGECDCQPRS